jgi:hypothetical protein
VTPRYPYAKSTKTISIGQLASSLLTIRRHVEAILDSVQKIGRDQREQRKTRVNWGAECAGLESLVAGHEKRIAGELAGHSAELVRIGNLLLEISIQIDRNTTIEQRLDLLGAGRRCFNMGADTQLASLIGMSLEIPRDRRGRKVAGPMFIAMACACSDNMKRNAEANCAAAQHAAERIGAAGWCHAMPATLQ